VGELTLQNNSYKLAPEKQIGGQVRRSWGPQFFGDWTIAEEPPKGHGFIGLAEASNRVNPLGEVK
jgi:hypothetical protein